MRTSRIKAKLRRNEPVLVTSLHFTDPNVYEMASLMGFDGIWMDLEHHPTSLETARELMRAARVGTADIMARPAKGEFMRLGRLLELGAQGIMYPRCDDAEEARQVVRWSKFAPLGTRGIDGSNPDVPYLSMPIAEYIRRANEETFLVVQIEDEPALQRAEAIAAVEGVDVVFLGPGDYSILGGFAGQFDDPRISDALRRLAEAARRAGKHWGAPCFSPEHGRMLLEMGAKFLAHGCDLVAVLRNLQRIQDDYAPLGFQFDNRLISSG